MSDNTNALVFSASLPKPRMGLCPKHGTVEAMWLTVYGPSSGKVTYRTPDLCGFCYAEAVEAMTTKLQPLPEKEVGDA